MVIIKLIIGVASMKKVLGEHIKRIIWSWHDTSFELVSIYNLSAVLSKSSVTNVAVLRKGINKLISGYWLTA